MPWPAPYPVRHKLIKTFSSLPLNSAILDKFRIIRSHPSVSSLDEDQALAEMQKKKKIVSQRKRVDFTFIPSSFVKILTKTENFPQRIATSSSRLQFFNAFFCACIERKSRTLKFVVEGTPSDPPNDDARPCLWSNPLQT